MKTHFLISNFVHTLGSQTLFLILLLIFARSFSIYIVMYFIHIVWCRYWNIIIIEMLKRSDLIEKMCAKWWNIRCCQVYMLFRVCVYKLIIIFVDIDLLYDVNHKKNGFIYVTCSQFNDKFVRCIGKKRNKDRNKAKREKWRAKDTEEVASWQKVNHNFKLDDLLTGIMWATKHHLISKW